MALTDIRQRMNVVKFYVESMLERTQNRMNIASLSSLISSSSQEDNAHNNSDNEFNLVSHFESLLVELQALLVWDTPANSAFALTFFTVFYW